MHFFNCNGIILVIFTQYFSLLYNQYEVYEIIEKQAERIYLN